MPKSQRMEITLTVTVSEYHDEDDEDEATPPADRAEVEHRIAQLFDHGSIRDAFGEVGLQLHGVVIPRD